MLSASVTVIAVLLVLLVVVVWLANELMGVERYMDTG
jgi:hypothetical protein